MDTRRNEAVTPDDTWEDVGARIDRWWNHLHPVDRHVIGAAVASCGVVMGIVMGTAG